MDCLKRMGVGLALWLIASHASATPNGAHLYERHCSACHGVTGQGGVGVPLALPSFLAGADDDFLFKTIRNGRPGRVMPAFVGLSDAEVQAIVQHVRNWSTESQPTLAATAPVKGNPQRGKALYSQHCASCHGANGEGGHGTGVTFSRPRDLPIVPPSLSNPGFLKAASDQMIKEALAKGREGTPMPSFRELGLSEADLDDMVSFIRSLEQTTTAWEPADDQEPYLEAESDYDLETTVENIKRAVVGKNFRLIRIQKLEEGLFPDEEADPNQVIIYFCNFSFVNEALALDPRVGLFMPCRITVVEHEGAVKLMTINPKYLSRLFNNAELDEACERMYDIYAGILEEATL